MSCVNKMTLKSKFKYLFRTHFQNYGTVLAPLRGPWGTTCTVSFIKIGCGIQKLMGAGKDRQTHTYRQTDREDGDLKSVLFLLERTPD
jgi:hypothetical protein